MKKTIGIFCAILIIVVLMGTMLVGASDFCRGFEVGYRSIKGDLVVLPVCPVEPVTPVGSNPYREGLKIGIAKARSE